MTTQIYAPNIHNFAFQLYQAANLDINSVSKDQDLNFIWENGNQIIQKVVKKDLKLIDKIDVSQSPDDRRVDLIRPSEMIGNSYFIEFDGKVSIPTTNQNVNIKGFARPLRFDDSYILWLNFRRPEEEPDNSGNNQKTDDVDISLLLEWFVPNTW